MRSTSDTDRHHHRLGVPCRIWSAGAVLPTRDHGPMAPLDGNPGDGVSAERASRGRISARIAAVAESATLAIDGKAKALQAAGEDVVGFGVGEPDFPTPAHIVEAAVDACRDPKNHRYTPAPGLPELREAIAAKTGARHWSCGRGGPGDRDQWRQAGRSGGVRHAA